MMVVATPSAPQTTTNTWSPLLPSENDKSKNVTTSSVTKRSTSTRFPSPTTTRISTPKRSVSADRRRPGPEMSKASKMVVTSARSLSVSFQGEGFAMAVSKTKVETPERRIGTPLRGRGSGCRDQVENSKPVDQHRWPGRTRIVNVKMNALSKSLNCGGDERSKVIGSGKVVRALESSLMDGKRSQFDGRMSLGSGNREFLKLSGEVPDVNSGDSELSVASDLTASDRDSVSSGSTGALDCVGGSRMLSGPRGIANSARFWQETNSRLRRLQDPGSPLSCSPGSKVVVPPKLRKFPSDNVLSSPRTMSSPIRSIRTASPSKVITPRGSSPSRGMPSPSRMRNGVSTISNSFTESASVLSYAVDVRRGQVGENRISDAHYLRLLYNKLLQWRFVNARTEESLLVQRHIAEITCLGEWGSLDKDHCTSLHGAIEALKASTLRLPAGGATANVHSLDNAVGSAIGVMQATLSSICSFLPKVEEVNSLVIELNNMTAKERASLEKCEDFLSNLQALEGKDFSLRTQIIQQKR